MRLKVLSMLKVFGIKIRVRIVELDNPPADGYTERYELLEVVLKEKIS